MQPEIQNGTSFGHVEIDIVKDDNVKGWPKIVLDINNITITKAQGKYSIYDIINALAIDHNSL